jgi:hypothetical protein
MKTLYFISYICATSSFAQQFVNKADNEVSTNLKKTMSNDSWDEMIKDNMSDLKISYYTYSFENNKSILQI